jgi:hypothetical protein
MSLNLLKITYFNIDSHSYNSFNRHSMNFFERSIAQRICSFTFFLFFTLATRGMNKIFLTFKWIPIKLCRNNLINKILWTMLWYSTRNEYSLISIEHFFEECTRIQVEVECNKSFLMTSSIIKSWYAIKSYLLAKVNQR